VDNSSGAYRSAKGNNVNINYSQEVSTSSSSSSSGNDSFGSGVDDFVGYNSNWDTNGDEKMSLSEANNWFRNGNGQPVNIDASKLTVIDFKDYDIVFGLGDYMVHGSVSLAPNGGIYDSTYDFDYKIKSDIFSAIRNAGNTLGLINAGKGKKFDTRFYNKPKVYKWHW
jgi:hypothetical protein